HGLSLVAASRGYSLVAVSTWVVVQGLSCHVACGIFPHPGRNADPLIGRQIFNRWTSREVLGHLFSCASCACGQLFATPCTVARLSPLSMEFSTQEYWSGLPFPSPGDLPNPGIKPGSPPPGKLTQICTIKLKYFFYSIFEITRVLTTGLPVNSLFFYRKFQANTFKPLLKNTASFLNVAGIPLPQNLSGYSLLPSASEMFKNEQNFKNLHPPWILSEFHGCNVNASTYMLRTNQWKYIAYSDGASVLPQLFDLSSDPDELTNIAAKFPEVTSSLDQKLRSIINYPKVSASVHQYNKEQFIKWKQSIGQNYSNVIANLRWHQDWLKEPKKYENAIDQWLKSHSDPKTI
ncbi:hypothetical protein FD754_024071, partial [Muntiacus muntjak]